MIGNSTAVALFLSMITNVQADINTAYEAISLNSKTVAVPNKRKEKHNPIEPHNLLEEIGLYVSQISELNQLIKKIISESEFDFGLAEIIDIQMLITDTMKYSDSFFSSLNDKFEFADINNINKIRFLLITTLAESVSVMEELRYKVQDKSSKSYALHIDQTRMENAIKSPTKRIANGMSREEMRKFIISHAT